MTVPQYEFPDLYNESYLVLLPRDPNCIYAYWELAPAVREMVKQKSESTGESVKLTLRVYDSTGLENNIGSTHNYFDLPLHPMADNYFIKGVAANRSYYIELGLALKEEGFTTILRSNTVNTPRNSIAEASETNLNQTASDIESGSGGLLIGSFANLGIYGESLTDYKNRMEEC